MSGFSSPSSVPVASGVGPIAEVGQVFTVEAFMYGYQGTPRLEIVYKVTVTDRDRGKRLQAVGEAFMLKCAMDTKHSHAWSCEGCDKPSRETITQVMSWMHIPSTGLWMGKPTEGPRLIVYLHPVCRYGSPCALAIQESGDQASRMAGGPPAAPMQAFDDDDDEEYPLHASCAYCELDKTATQKLLNCAGCKVTRYCSVACQKEDWSRHKQPCLATKIVRLVVCDEENDDEEATTKLDRK